MAASLGCVNLRCWMASKSDTRKLARLKFPFRAQVDDTRHMDGGPAAGEFQAAQTATLSPNPFPDHSFRSAS